MQVHLQDRYDKISFYISFVNLSYGDTENVISVRYNPLLH